MSDTGPSSAELEPLDPQDCAFELRIALAHAPGLAALGRPGSRALREEAARRLAGWLAATLNRAGVVMMRRRPRGPGPTGFREDTPSIPARPQGGRDDGS